MLDKLFLSCKNMLSWFKHDKRIDLQQYEDSSKLIQKFYAEKDLDALENILNLLECMI